MYNNPYNSYNLDRVNNQISELEKIKQQLTQQPQPTNLTQNFQLAPTNHLAMKYANSIEEVKKEIVVADTPYFSNDLSVLWLKNAKGDIRAYELKEIVQKDEKDLIIESLQIQIKELNNSIKEIKDYARTNNSNNVKSTESEEPSIIQTIRTKKTTK